MADYDYKHDFFSFPSPQHILAPHPDLFESDLDSSLAAFDQLDLQLLTVHTTHPTYSSWSDSQQGPPSTITASSESASAYDSLSSNSFYNYDDSFPFPIELDMEFQNISVTQPASDYGPDPTPSRTPPRTPDTTNHFSAPPPRSSFSDYGPSRTSSEDYYQPLPFASTVTPAHLSSLSASPLSRPDSESDDTKSDPRRRYKCSSCPRAFARAYNLKTHMATHDPNRLKPHVCSHRSCGRSFSRKHDLARHQVSLHGAQKSAIDHHPLPAVYHAKKSIGVDNRPRAWCEGCGKGWIGRVRDSCSCDTP